LYEKHSEDVEFLTIYIREAHPKDGWWLGGGISGLALKLYGSGAATDVYDPKTMLERRSVAGRCETALQYGIPTLVDDMDDTVNRAYAAMPTRIYLIGLDGHVDYAGDLGPWGFSPEELKEAIHRLPESQIAA
jgi:hypothetical protein